MGILDVFIAECRGVTAPTIPPPEWLGGAPSDQVGQDRVLDAAFDRRRLAAPYGLDNRRLSVSFRFDDYCRSAAKKFLSNSLLSSARIPEDTSERWFMRASWTRFPSDPQ